MKLLPNGAIPLITYGGYVLAFYQGGYVTWSINELNHTVSGNYHHADFEKALEDLRLRIIKYNNYNDDYQIDQKLIDESNKIIKNENLNDKLEFRFNSN